MILIFLYVSYEGIWTSQFTDEVTFSLTFRPGFFAILSILFVFWLVEPNIFKKTGPWPVINPYRKFNPNYDLEPGQSN
jgi:hypothetical protein